MRSFYDKEKNTNRLNALANALSSTKNNDSTTTTITPYQPINGQDENQNQNSMSASDGMLGLMKGGMGLYNGLNNAGILGNSSGLGGGSSNTAITDAVNNNIFGGGTGSSSAITDAINNNMASSGGGFGSGFGGSMPWAAIGTFGKGLYNNISGHDDKHYSDTEQSIIYPLQGASKGAQFGPWGALGGALYGLGYSFKDDVGLDDSNFFTQMLFPLGMGDGGGLRINGEPVLDIL